jgi:hypothetical protein
MVLSSTPFVLILSPRSGPLRPVLLPVSSLLDPASDMPPVCGHRSDSASPSSSPQDNPIVVKYMDASDAASDSAAAAAAATGASHVESGEDVAL